MSQDDLISSLLNDIATGVFGPNILFMILCYAYIVIVILIGGRLESSFGLTPKIARKFIHAMIGNLVFIIPFFSSNVYPVLVAAPFILVTLFASPYSPSTELSLKLQKLLRLTEEGHELGLVFYAISYTVLALFFGSTPYYLAAGILPLAYGDSLAAILGEKYGRTKFTILTQKSVQGTLGMFLGSFVSLSIGFIFYSLWFSFSFFDLFVPMVTIAMAATAIELSSPKGVDNLTIPLSCSIFLFLLLGGMIY